MTSCKFIVGSRSAGWRTSPQRRGGVSLLEMLVALSLLGGGLSLAASLLVRHARLLSEYHDYQCALDELSNQMDRLTALGDQERAAEIAQLQPSELAGQELDRPQLTGTLEPAEFGQKLTLRLAWGDDLRRQNPLVLAGWVAGSDSQTAEEAQP